MVAIVAAAIFVLVTGLYIGSTPSTLPSQPSPASALQTSQTFTQDNRVYDEAAIPLVVNQQYRLDGIIFTYLGNATAEAGQCPPADLKSVNELYQGNEIKHFSAVLKNGTKVGLDSCWPLPHVPPSKTGSGVSVPLQKRVESRWFDPDKTAGIMQDPAYFVPGNTTFYYFAERTGQ